MSPLWSDMAIATAVKAATKARRAVDRAADPEPRLRRIGNGRSVQRQDTTPRRPIRHPLTSYAL